MVVARKLVPRVGSQSYVESSPGSPLDLMSGPGPVPRPVAGDPWAALAASRASLLTPSSRRSWIPLGPNVEPCATPLDPRWGRPIHDAHGQRPPAATRTARRSGRVRLLDAESTITGATSVLGAKRRQPRGHRRCFVSARPAARRRTQPRVWPTRPRRSARTRAESMFGAGSSSRACCQREPHGSGESS